MAWCADFGDEFVPLFLMSSYISTSSLSNIWLAFLYSAASWPDLGPYFCYCYYYSSLAPLRDVLVESTMAWRILSDTFSIDVAASSSNACRKKYASPSCPRSMATSGLSTPLTVIVTLLLAALSSLSLPKRTWNGELFKLPSDCYTQTMSMHPLRVALLMLNMLETPLKKLIIFLSDSREFILKNFII